MIGVHSAARPFGGAVPPLSILLTELEGRSMDNDEQLQRLAEEPLSDEQQGTLDEMVTEMATQIASDVNNQGASHQIEYLLSNGIEADDVLRRLR